MQRSGNPGIDARLRLSASSRRNAASLQLTPTLPRVQDAKPVRFLPAAAILAVFVALDVFHLQAHDTSVQPATIFDSMRAVYWPQAWTTAHVSSALARVCGVAFATISMERALSAMREHNPHRTRYAAAAVAAVLLLPQYVQ